MECFSGDDIKRRARREENGGEGKKAIITPEAPFFDRSDSVLVGERILAP